MVTRETEEKVNKLDSVLFAIKSNAILHIIVPFSALLFLCSSSTVAQEDSEALWESIRKDDFGETHAILVSGADPNKRFKNGKTPIQVARSRNVLALLISAGAVLTPSVTGESLIEHYSRLSKDRSSTPQQTGEYLRMIKFLTERGEKISPVAAAYLGKVTLIRDQILTDPDWIYSSEAVYTAIAFVEAENLEGLRLLLVGGLNADWTVFENGYRSLPLLLHSADKPIEFARLLCVSGADVNAKIRIIGGLSGSPMGDAFTVLGTSAKLGESQLTKLLIDFGADVNAIDSLGRTPLFYAVYFSPEAAAKDSQADQKNNLQRYMETIRILLSHGALVDVKDVNDESPLTLLDSLNVPESVKSLFPVSVHLKTNAPLVNDSPPER